MQPHGLEPARLLCPWGFSRQEYWSGLTCPPPGDLPNPGIEPVSLALTGWLFTTSATCLSLPHLKCQLPCRGSPAQGHQGGRLCLTPPQRKPPGQSPLPLMSESPELLQDQHLMGSEIAMRCHLPGNCLGLCARVTSRQHRRWERSELGALELLGRPKWAALGAGTRRKEAFEVDGTAGRSPAQRAGEGT